MPKIAKQTAFSGSKYPWEEWLDGRERIFRSGSDFHCSAASFVRQARLAAERAGMKVEATITHRIVANKATQLVHLRSVKGKR